MDDSTSDDIKAEKKEAAAIRKRQAIIEASIRDLIEGKVGSVRRFRNCRGDRYILSEPRENTPAPCGRG